MSDLPKEDGFLSRWSRRKRLGEEAAPEPEAPLVAEAAPADPEPASAPPTPAERARRLIARLTRRQDPTAPVPAFDLSSLPSIESLTAESDIAAFLQQGVPVALRNAALKRIWTLDPAIRDFIGPLDYGWDFNAPDGVPGFGLDLGGADVTKLLAQAIGQLAEDASAEASALAEVERAAAAAPLPPAPRAEAVIPEPEVAEPPPDPPAGPPRRRHGGALPT